jgi:hypothetical protein
MRLAGKQPKAVRMRSQSMVGAALLVPVLRESIAVYLRANYSVAFGGLTDKADAN